MTDKDLLEAYTIKLMLNEPLTLQELINSHRTIRQEYGDMWRNRLEVLSEARQLGYEQGLRKVTEDFVSWDDLSKMTITEIVKKLEHYVD